jgi:hypothetical protein
VTGRGPAQLNQPAREARHHLVREHLLHLARHAREEKRLGGAQRHHEPGRDPGCVGQRPRAVRDADLTEVVGRQLEPVRREPLLHRLQRRLVGRRAGDQQLGHDVDGAVVFGRPQAPGRDDDVHLGAQPHQGGANRLRIVGHHHLLGQLVASLEQPLREERGV